MVENDLIIAAQHTNAILPEGNKSNELLLNTIISSIGVPRNVVPDDYEISYALQELPRELNRIPINLRDKFIARACIASSVGLFDGAIIYIWNSVIKELRRKVDKFGLEMIKHIRGNKVEDNFLDNIRDADLLLICRQLNIISEQGYFYLDQCRDTRNNASAAHPSDIEIDDRELINFISRCAKYGLSDDFEVSGIDFKSLISVLESTTTTDDNLHVLGENIKNTFDSQKEFIFSILYSNYIDSTVNEVKRNNSIKLAKYLTPIINNKIIVDLLEKHNEKKMKEEQISVTNSMQFLREMNLISHLSESEKTLIFKKATINLFNAHNGMNNFYNEPPFAERLLEVSTQIKPIPELVKGEYINTILDCYFGNGYGTSTSAMPFYTAMFQNLTPKELEYLLNILKNSNSSIMQNVMKTPWKKNLFIEMLNNIEQNVGEHIKLVNLYNEILNKYSLNHS